MGNEKKRLDDLDHDPRGRVVDPRPLDRFFYDRNKTQVEEIPSPQFRGGFLLANWPKGTYARIYVYEGEDLIATYSDDSVKRAFPVPGGTRGRNLSAKGAFRDADQEPEKREYDRHQTMFWELLSDYLGENGYSKWYKKYYQKAATTPEDLTHWPSYGKGDSEDFPFGDTENNPPALKRVPGMNVGPNQDSANTGGDVDGVALDKFHRAWDQTQEAFGAARGCYEVWTDIFVDITDGFRGGYQNGDTRWIFKTPINEEYKWVNELHEHLYGMKDGWTWTAIAGSKENQCATLGGQNWGRSVIEETYVGYRGAASTKLADGEHAYDRQNSDGSARTETQTGDLVVGDPNDYAVVVKDQIGPAASNKNELEAVEGDGYDQATGHMIWSQSTVGGSSGVVVTDKVFEESLESLTTIGSDVTLTERKDATELYTKTEIGGLSVEEKIGSGWVDTTIHGNDKETVHGNKVDHHFGNNAAMHLGANEELFVGAKVGLTVGYWLECVIGIPGPVTGAAAGTLAGPMGTGVGAVAGAAATPTEIFVGEKREVFVGTKQEFALAGTLSMCVGHLMELAPKKTQLFADTIEFCKTKKHLIGDLKYFAAMVDLG